MVNIIVEDEVNIVKIEILYYISSVLDGVFIFFVVLNIVFVIVVILGNFFFLIVLCKVMLIYFLIKFFFLKFGSD